MKLTLGLSCLLVSVSTFLNAQVGGSKQTDVQEIKNRTLLVVTEEPNPKLTAKLSAAALDSYNKDIEDYNKNIKAAVTLCWKFNDKIDYKTRGEVDKLCKSKSKDYAYVDYNYFTVNCANAASYKATLGLKDSTTGGIALVGGDYIATEMDICLTEDGPLAVPVFGVRMGSPFPNEADLVYGLKSIQLQLGYKLAGTKDNEINNMVKVNGKLLQNMTLLVDKNNTDLKIEEIKKAYPYPVQLVSKEKIDQALLTSNDTVAFVIVIPLEGNNFSFEVLSAKDCTELARSNPDQNTGVSIGGIGPIDEIKDMTKSKLKKDHFKIFAKNVK
jgi:hypothetical protein